MRQKFFVLGISALIITAVIYYYFNIGLFLMVVLIVLLVVGFANASQYKHTILRNFPVLDALETPENLK